MKEIDCYPVLLWNKMSLERIGFQYPIIVLSIPFLLYTKDENGIINKKIKKTAECLTREEVFILQKRAKLAIRNKLIEDNLKYITREMVNELMKNSILSLHTILKDEIVINIKCEYYYSQCNWLKLYLSEKGVTLIDNP